jgi:hypothetical protein
MRKLFILLPLLAIAGCYSVTKSSDDIQRNQQEAILKEATAQTGMPSIKNLRERKLMKDILEMRDQDGLITYTYIENLVPTIAHGRTVLHGKFTLLGESVGYAIPYATQYTNPQKSETYWEHGAIALPQADPNGLFSPVSAEGSWVLLKNPSGNGTKPVYVEPRVMVSPFPFPLD